ncbi:MAG: hypothetical protein GY696_17620 [Gammaproteobacteria bacterium]|nr:hypothetical protein [Gammaproteobacteria bacterium]
MQYKVQGFFGFGQQILVPEQLKDAVFQVSHEEAMARHFGVTTAMAKIRKKFWYPEINVETQLRVQAFVVGLHKTMKEKTNAGTCQLPADFQGRHFTLTWW